MRVLVIEDDRELAEAIKIGFQRESFAVDLAFDGDSGLERALVNCYDVIVLDRDLPGTHGDEICHQLMRRGGSTVRGLAPADRAAGAGLYSSTARGLAPADRAAGAGLYSSARVLMLTASATIEDRVGGLDLGADDYLSKPFAFAELVARVRALFRRCQPALPPVLDHGGVRLDPATHAASRGDRALDLAPKEFGTLHLLLAAGGRVVSAEELLERVWDEMADPFTSSVKVTISRLRRKLGDPVVIETVAQAGYRIRS